MNPTDKPTCVGRKWDGWDWIPCGKTASTEHEGKPYCKIHNPAMKEDRERRREIERLKLRDARWAQAKVANDQERDCEFKAEAFPLLFNALTRLLHACESDAHWETNSAAVTEARAALDAAKPKETAP